MSAEYPFRRSITGQPQRTTPWIIGQYSGFSDPESTNRRFREIIAKGGQGLSIALDLPTQWGLDPDHDLARGEIGRAGVSLSSLDDLDRLFVEVDLSAVRQISTTANAIGPVVVALWIALARRRGMSPRDIAVRIQNDPLKEYVARGTHVLAVDAGAEFAIDAIEYCAMRLPGWIPMTISGYHIRDAGATRGQELGFTLAHTRDYFERAQRRGLDVTAVARSVSWFLAASSAPIHEAAKFRAARELWASMLHDEFGVTDEQALKLRLVAYTLGGEMTPFEVQNNSVRIALAATAAVLGGVQTLYCSAIDEALGLPSDESALLSVRTQQILFRESELPEFVDILGGAPAVEGITEALIAEAHQLERTIAGLGGATAAIESGWTRGKIDEAAWDQELERREQPRVGEEPGAARQMGDIRLFQPDPAAEQRRRDSFAHWRAARSAPDVDGALDAVRAAIVEERNPIEAMADAFAAKATIGELMGIVMDERGLASDRTLLRPATR